MKKSKGPSPAPQQVSPEIWYYENRWGIEVYVDLAMVRDTARSGTCLNFRIRKRMLKKSLARMEER